MDTVLEIRPVERANWQGFEQLFEERGGPKSCWCMVWRDYSRVDGNTDKAARKEGMRERIQGGEAVGLLAYLNGEPVAWCSVAPRKSFKASLSGNVEAKTDCTIWSLTCFFVKRSHRGQGLSASLIEAASQYARSHGARMLEAYPVAPDSPSYRFCGFVAQFERHGFRTIGSVGSRRHVVVMDL